MLQTQQSLVIMITIFFNLCSADNIKNVLSLRREYSNINSFFC